jgi:serine-type D-Ala-D-Ala carboxypeptidase/endopeptidase
MCLHLRSVFGLALGIVSMPLLTPAALALDLRPKIDPLAQPLVDDGLVVGMVVGIVQDGRSQVIAYGETVKGSGVAPNADTVYEIGSVTKAFTGVLLADMMQRGLMKPDDPAQGYLPQGVKMPIVGDRPITLEQLATHTSGLPRLPENLDSADPVNPYADYSEQRLFDFLNRHQLRRPPGTYAYSNLGMGLLGRLIARESRKSYEQVLIDRVCEPLGMTDTIITLNTDQRERLAPPYNASLQPDHNWDFDALAGAGAIRSTCRDMITFIQANLADDDRPVTRALRWSHRKRNDMNSGQTIGLGWHIARDGITRWHNGMTGGYHAWLAVVPDRNVGVVVLANTANMKITAFGEQVTRIALGGEAERPQRRKTIEVDAGLLETYEGVYELTPKFRLTVTVEDGKLMVQATDQPKFQVFPESKTEFYYKVVDAQLTFVARPDGKVTRLVLHQNGVDQQAVRRE